MRVTEHVCQCVDVRTCASVRACACACACGCMQLVYKGIVTNCPFNR